MTELPITAKNAAAAHQALKYYFRFLSSRLKRLARTAPEILCHTEKTAPGTVAMGRPEKAVDARDVASPEFCIPTSMESAFFFGADI